MAKYVRTDIRVETDDFDVAEEWTAMRARLAGRAGAVVSFAGIVRDHAGADEVRGLYLEHYPGMTEASIDKILAKASDRWELIDTVVIHRVGELAPRDQIVLVLVAAAHRPDAFAACEFIMDYLKTDAVFWKKEHRPGGDTWIGATANDQERRNGWQADDG